MSIHKGLSQAAGLVETGMREILDSGMGQGGYPSGDDRSERGYKRIQDTIEVGTVQNDGGGVMSITITVGGEDAPYTVAFEFGSGLHGKKGAEYDIPVGAKGFLAWPVGSYPNRWEQYSGNLGAGQDFIIELGVRHPGIKAKPFVRPALKKSLPQIRKILGQAFKAEVLSKVKRVTVITA